MKSVIPFTKELDFSTKVSEITSISLEREFEVEQTSVTGNLFVTGDYKSHEVSANVIPFSFKIPFTIEISDHLKKESIALEISDFAYEMEDSSKIKVSIELELEGEEEEIEQSEEEAEQEPVVEVDPDELLRMMEEESIPIVEEDPYDVSYEKETDNGTIGEDNGIIEEEEMRDIIEEVVEKTTVEKEEEKMEANEELIIQNSKTGDDEYATYHIHIVKDGETVETICTMYNSNLSMLSDYNNVSEISTGSKIIIPQEYEP